MTIKAFADRLASRVAAAQQQDSERATIEAEGMRERSARLTLLEREGLRIHGDIIQPRVAALARALDAVVEHYRSPSGYQSYLRCERSARFPATARLGIGVEWDTDGTDAWLVCNVEIVPVLMALPGDARMPLRWDGPDRDEAAGWVEERILLFLEACLQVMREPAYQQDRLRRDPVCGMQVSQDRAAVAEYNARRYYFCSASCEDRFRNEPALYVGGRVELAT